MATWKAKAYDSIEDRKVADAANMFGSYEGFKTKEACQTAIDQAMEFFDLHYKAAIPVKVTEKPKSSGVKYGILNKKTGGLVRYNDEACTDNNETAYLRTKFLEENEAPDCDVFTCVNKELVDNLVGGYRNDYYHDRESTWMTPETHEVVELQITYKKIK